MSDTYTEKDYYADEASSFAIGFGEYLRKYCIPSTNIPDRWLVINYHPSLRLGFEHETAELYKHFVKQLEL